jgi:hypothetical protein
MLPSIVALETENRLEACISWKKLPSSTDEFVRLMFLNLIDIGE